MNWTAAGWQPSGWSPRTPKTVKAPQSLGHEDDLPLTSKLAANHEQALKRELLRAWEQAAAMLDLRALSAAAARESELELDMLAKPDQQFALLQQALIPRLTSAYVAGLDHGVTELQSLGIPVSPRKALHADLSDANQEAAAWALQHVLEGRDNFTTAQRDNIREVISQANIEGMSPDEVADYIVMMVGLRADQVRAVGNFRQRLRDDGIAEERVRARGAKYADAQRRSRAQTIARTELIAAANGGQQGLWDRAIRQGALKPEAVRKIWIVTPDERLCPQCEPLGYQHPVPISQPFTHEGVMHPPLHPNCRCAMGLVKTGVSAQLAGGSSSLARTSPWRGIGNRFDPQMRKLIRQRAEFWSNVASEKSVDNLVAHAAQIAGVPEDRLARTEVGSPWMTDWLGVRGAYSAKEGGVMTLSPRTAKYLQRLIDLGPEAARTDPKVFQSLQVVFHELEHARSPLAKLGHLTSWKDIPGGANPVLSQFFEEGLAETFARRNTAALVFGNTPRAKLPSWLRTSGFYEEYVKELEFYESKIGGPGSLNKLFSLSAKSREQASAKMIQSWMGRALRAHANPKVVEAWEKLVELDQKLKPFQRVLGLSYGFASHMETMTAEQIHEGLLQLAANNYTNGNGHDGWLDAIVGRVIGARPGRMALDAPQPWKFDPFARQLARRSQAFWDGMHEIRRAGSREDVVRHLADTMGANLSAIKLNSPEVDVIPGGRAFFDADGRIMHVGSADTALIPSITVGGRAALADNANVYRAFNVLVHELVHSLDPALSRISTTPMTRGEGEAERIATEAFTDMLARRYSSVLAFSGSPYAKKRPASAMAFDDLMRGRMRFVDANAISTAYDAYVHGLRQFENRFGAKSILDLFWRPQSVSIGLYQTYSRATALNGLNLLASDKDLFNHGNLATRTQASLLSNLFHSAPVYENIIIWSTGFFEAMKNPFTLPDGSLSDIFPDPLRIADQYRQLHDTIQRILSHPPGPNVPFSRFFAKDYPENQFDAGLRSIVKASDGFWEKTFPRVLETYNREMQAGYGAGEGIRSFTEEVAQLIAIEGKRDEYAYNLEGIVSESEKADRHGYLGFYSYDEQAIHLSTGTSHAIAELLRLGSDALKNGSRFAAKRIVTALHTIVHEGIHAARSPAPYGTHELIFMEEGVTELLTRRYLAGLLTPFRNTLGSPVNRLEKATSYEPYVREMSWFEKTFGTKAIYELHDRTAAHATGDVHAMLNQTGAEARLNYAADKIKFGGNSWLARALTNHSSEMVRQYAGAFYDVLKGADSFKIVQLWEEGFFRSMDQMGFLSFESILYHTGGLGDAMRAHGIPVRDR